ncbi:MAG: hypothetical protein ABJN34_08975 [Litoreibacter sp.]|uniref:hypothetical protein n=1 Tax=Litoreibacter sp. TaxID=1969459 RepID=UPI0032997246
MISHENRDTIVVCKSLADIKIFSPADVKMEYVGTNSILEIGEQLGLASVYVIQMLDLVQIDFLTPLHKRHQRGENCVDLAREIGISSKKLRQLFAEKSLPVNRGRPRRRFSQRELAEAAMNNKTVRSFANHLGVRWATARMLLMRYSLATHTKCGWFFETNTVLSRRSTDELLV